MIDLRIKMLCRPDYTCNLTSDQNEKLPRQLPTLCITKENVAKCGHVFPPLQIQTVNVAKNSSFYFLPHQNFMLAYKGGNIQKKATVEITILDITSNVNLHVCCKQNLFISASFLHKNQFVLKQDKPNFTRMVISFTKFIETLRACLPGEPAGSGQWRSQFLEPRPHHLCKDPMQIE